MYLCCTRKTPFDVILASQQRRLCKKINFFEVAGENVLHGLFSRVVFPVARISPLFHFMLGNTGAVNPLVKRFREEESEPASQDKVLTMQPFAV